MKRCVSLTLAMAFACAGAFFAADKDAKSTDPVAGAPIMIKPSNGPAGISEAKGLQNAAMHEDFMKMVMEASSKIEAAKNAIADRQEKLNETSPVVMKIRKQMIGMQKEINNIVESDPEYSELKIKRDILATIMPGMPKSSFPMSMPGGMGAPGGMPPPRPMGPVGPAPMGPATAPAK